MTAPVFAPEFAEQLNNLFTWRRDVRHFQTLPLEPGMIDALLDIACLAPSVGNSQPWRLVHVVSPERRAAIIAHVENENAQAAALYQDQDRAHYDELKLHGLIEAPEHIGVFCERDPKEGRGLGRQTMPETLIYSTVLAIHTLWLAACARGVGMGWVSILEPTSMTTILNVPPEWRFIGYLCLGYPLEPHNTPELERRRWQARIAPAHTRFTR